MPADDRAKLLDYDSLKAFCSGVLTKLGVPADDAEQISHCLIDADLRGVHSHGAVRFKLYVDRLKAGGFNPKPEIRVVHETRTTAIVDGDNGMGQLVCRRAMELAIDKAAADGDCVWVAVRNSNHNGAEAYFTEMAAARDMVGFCFTIGAVNHMAPWGGAEAVLGNNPFSIALPAGAHPPVSLDMACSVAARGKVNVAAARGEPIPEGWCTDAEGRPTTDPHKALQGFVLPIAGPKGYALTTMIGMLSTMLTGAAFGRDMTHMYEDLGVRQNIGHLVGVIPIASFVNPSEFKARVDRGVADIKGVKRAPGVDEIFLPGEREVNARRARLAEGVPIATGTVAELEEIAAEFGLAPPRAV